MPRAIAPGGILDALAVVLDQPGSLALRTLPLAPMGEGDVVVDVRWTGVSTGTERLLWAGTMPPFPGLGYPLVPGYEAVGVVSRSGSGSGRQEGEFVYVPGSNGFVGARGLFGAAARRLVLPGARVHPIPEATEESGCLLALAATAHHALHDRGALALPDLVVGHGALGRLAARLTVALGGSPPTVWEVLPERSGGARGYPVVAPDQDVRRDYARILDVSGSATLLDPLIGRLAPGGELVLAGFYDRVSFDFPPAFLREARLRVAAEWGAADLAAAAAGIRDGSLDLDGLVTHVRPSSEARDAYATAFNDPACVKMILDWRDAA